MSRNRIELKVGVFVLVALALIAVLALRFSETGLSLGRTYTLRLHAPNAGGLIPDSPVMMAGVRIGYLDRIALDTGQTDTNKLVTLHVQIHQQYQIPADSKFHIETAGFLGDQYIAVMPMPGTGGMLTANAEAFCEAPISLQETARSLRDSLQETAAAGRKLIQNADDMIGSLSNTFTRIDQKLLNNNTLTNITSTVSNFQAVSADVRRFTQGMDQVAQQLTNFVSRSAEVIEKLNRTAGNVNQLVTTNSPAIASSITNINMFTKSLSISAQALQTSLTNNTANVQIIVSNLASVTDDARKFTASANQLMTDLQAGRGLAGNLLKDEQTMHQFRALLTNLNTAVHRFSTLTSNLNTHGLLHKPRPGKPRPPSAVRSIRP